MAALARDIFNTPIALISLIDETRQWFKARVGLEVRQTPRDWAFCTHTIASGAEVFVVPDASQDSRFASNPLVNREPHIRFYAAASLTTPDGFKLGTVCVISDQPRPAGLTATEGRWLTTLAKLASDELELRLQVRRAKEAAAAEARLRRAQEAAGVIAFEVSATATEAPGKLQATLRRLFGLREETPLELHGFAVRAAAVDRPRLEALAADVAARGGTISEEFRATLGGGGPRWIQVRGAVELCAAGGTHWRAAGLIRDVTERRLSDERQELITRELDHRAKNALAVVLAALQLTPADDPRAYATAVQGRVAALVRAHTLLSQSQWAGAYLDDVVRGELRAFCAAAPTGGPRVNVEGPRVLLSASAIQPLSMALHELATNAVKHGALSTAFGQVTVTWKLDSEILKLRWLESGGPLVTAPPDREGFGSRMMRGTVVEQLGGTLRLVWPNSGLICDLSIPVDSAVEGAATDGTASKTPTC